MSKRETEEFKSFIKEVNVPDFKIDGLDPANYSKKPLNEKITRRKFLARARQMGCEKEVSFLFTKYDSLLRKCNTDEERKNVAQLGAYEVGKLLAFDQLVIDGTVVIKQ